MRNINLIFFKFILREYYYMEQKPGQWQKEKDSKIQAMGMLWTCDSDEKIENI